MMRIFLKPVGWSCTLEDAPPGPVIILPLPGVLAFKTEYDLMPGVIEHFDLAGNMTASMRQEEKKPDTYNEAGERLCIDSDCLVQPVEMKWDEE